MNAEKNKYKEATEAVKKTDAATLWAIVLEAVKKGGVRS